MMKLWRALDTEPGTLADDIGTIAAMIAMGAAFYFFWGITR